MLCCYLLLGLVSFASYIHISHEHPVMPFSNNLSVVWLQLKPNPIAIIVDSSGRFIGTLPGNILEPPARIKPAIPSARKITPNKKSEVTKTTPNAQKITPNQASEVTKTKPTAQKITPNQTSKVAKKKPVGRKIAPGQTSKVTKRIPTGRKIAPGRTGKVTKRIPTGRKIAPGQTGKMNKQNQAATYITKTIQDSSGKLAEKTSPLKVQPPKKLVPIGIPKNQPARGHRGMEITLTGKSVEISSWSRRPGKGKYSSTYPAERVSPWKLTSIPKPKAIGVAPEVQKIAIIPKPIAISVASQPKKWNVIPKPIAIGAAAKPNKKTTPTVAPTTTTVPPTTTALETTTELETTTVVETTTETATTPTMPPGEAAEPPDYPPTTTPSPAEMYRFWLMMKSGGEMPEPGEGPPVPEPEPAEPP